MAKAKKEISPFVPVEEQPYPVPENWCWVSIDSINQYKSGSIDPMKSPDCIFELYSVPSSSSNYPEILQGSEIGSTKQAVEKGDVLLCKINPRINRVWSVSQHTEYQLLASSEWIVVRNTAFVPSFLMFYFQTKVFREYMLSNVSGVGGSLMRAQPKFVKEYPIPIAPLAEQQRIVDRIESLFAKLDEAKEKAQAVVDSYEQRKAAILHQAFTGELTKEWRKANAINDDSWSTHCLKDCCKIGSGGTPSRKNPEYYDGNIPWIKTGEIEWNEIYDSEESISEIAIENSSAKIYPPGAVLVAMYGMGVTRGRAAILKVYATTNQAVCVLQPEGYLHNYYLFFFFMCNYWDIREYAVGGNQLNLSGTIISKFEIPVPSFEEQTEIVRILDNLLTKEQQAKETAEAVIDQIELMKKSILARAFRGALGTNDPSEESAAPL